MRGDRHTTRIERGRAVGRWLSPQPNIIGSGVVAGYSRRFWAVVVVVGVGSGVAGSLLMTLLSFVEHVAWGYHSGTFLAAARAASAWRHIVVLLVAAAIAGAGALVLARLPTAGAGEISEALWLRGARLPIVPSCVRAVVSIVTVAMGSSLGREGAPQLAGAAIATRMAEWASLPAWQRRLLVASGAGAGMAAVYDVPLGGALFALEVLLGTLALPLVLPALATSVIATAVAWIALGNGPTYHVPSYSASTSTIVWALLMGPIAGVAAVGWVRAVRRVNALRPRGLCGRVIAPLAVFVVLGAISIPYPQLVGNGSDVVQLTAVGGISLGLVAILLLLKPIVTAACLGSGSPGGLFTPTLTIGVLLAGVTGAAWSHLWPGAPTGSCALIGGAAFLAAAMQGPLSAVVLVLELTRHTDALMVPTLIAITEATVIARRAGAPSIYSARLVSGGVAAGPGSGGGVADGGAAGVEPGWPERSRDGEPVGDDDDLPTSGRDQFPPGA